MYASRSTLSIVCMSTLSLPALAQDGPDMYINGFLTLGAAITDGNLPYYDRIDKQPRIDGPDTKLGLNLYGQLDDRWQAVTQITARAFTTDYALRADWMFVSYNYDDMIEFKFGRQKYPIRIMSDYIDVGRAYPWVRPPEEVYDMFPLKTMSGVNLQISTDELIEDYRLFFEVYGGGAREVLYGDIQGEFLSDQTFGATLRASGDELQLRLAYLQVNFSSDSLQIDTTSANLISSGLEFDNGNLLVLSEAVVVNDISDEEERKKRQLVAQQEFARAQASGDQEALAEAQLAVAFSQGELVGGTSGYVTVGYYLGEWLPHLTYARMFDTSAAALGSEQTTLTVGTRYAFNPKTDLKLEWKHIQLPDTPGENGLYGDTQSTAEAKRESNVISFAFNVNF